jgi:hypothetical protein
MKHRFVTLVLLAAASLASAQSAPSASAPSTDRFDGDWLVTMSCPTNTEKSAALGYKRQFIAQVKDGFLRGEQGSEAAPGFLRIGGRIGGDGSALFNARGRTGNPDFAVAHPPSSSPYSFSVEARFDASHGSGKRLEQRECSFAFDRK